MSKITVMLALFGLFMVILLWGQDIVTFFQTVAALFHGPAPMPVQPVPAP